MKWKFFKRLWFIPATLIGVIIVIGLISIIFGYYRVQIHYGPTYQEPEIEEGAKTWIKEFEKPGYDVAKSIRQTSDDGYIAAGALDNEANKNISIRGQPVSDVYLLKLDSDGNKTWERMFRGRGAANGAESVQQTSDKGYVIVGSTSAHLNITFDAYLIKTDENGNKLWEREFDLFGMKRNDVAFYVQQTTDGGYILGGNTDAYISKFKDAFLLKTDAYGNKLWEKNYGGDEYEDIRSAQQTSDSGYIIAGSTMSFNSTRIEDVNIYLVKTDADGNTTWERAIDAFDKHEQDGADDIQQTSDGGYILAGGTSSVDVSRSMYGYLLKVDANGNKVWENAYGGSGSKLVSVQQTSDRGYIATGHTSAVPGTDVYLLKTDINGNKVWEKAFRWNVTVRQTPEGRIETIGMTHRGHSVQQTSDGGYVIAGEIDYGFTDPAAFWQEQSNIFLIKTDGNGNVYDCIGKYTDMAKTCSIY